MISGQSVLTPGNRGGPRQPQVTVIRDYQACIPLTRILGEGDIVLLLTPVVTPYEQNGSDPFEPLGRALATRHPWIRHVPYTARNGITNTHVGFIKRAKAVIFIISGPPNAGQISQVEIARSLGQLEMKNLTLFLRVETSMTSVSWKLTFRRSCSYLDTPRWI